MSDHGEEARVECVFPILRVENMRASLAFYTTVLGFKVDWGGDATLPGMASVSRNGMGVMLSEGGHGNPGTWIWIGVTDARQFHEEFACNGAKIVLPPTNYYWALEFRVEDPDGHILRFGSEPEDAPFQTPD